MPNVFTFVSPNVVVAMAMSVVPSVLLMQFFKLPIDHWVINPADIMHDWLVKAINLLVNCILVCVITSLLPGGFSGGKDIAWAILGTIYSFLASDALYTNVRGPQPITPVDLSYRARQK